VLPRALLHRACHLPRKGSGVAMCPEAPSTPPPGKGSSVATCPEAPSPLPDTRGLWSCHVPHGSRPAPCAERLWHCHMIEALGPPLDRAPVPLHVLWLLTCLLVWEGSGETTCPVALSPQACLCFPKMPDIRLIMASLGMPCMQRIKCVCGRPYATYGWH
jgi:hypothetical protein